MRWQGFATGVVLMACSGVAIAQPPQDAMEDQTVLAALSLLGLPRAEWPQIKFGAPEGYVEPEKSLELFGAFRVRRGRELDPVIYLNPNHQFYLEARSGGADVYPLFRLASVIWHEMQHGQGAVSEASALEAQAAFLRRALIRIPVERRGRAMAYIASLERAVPAARQWDASGRYPSVPQ
jgi:hypothetical protein